MMTIVAAALFAHRHIVDRPGLANGDLKSKGAL